MDKRIRFEAIAATITLDKICHDLHPDASPSRQIKWAISAGGEDLIYILYIYISYVPFSNNFKTFLIEI